MVALQHEDRNPRSIQLAQLRGCPQAGSHVLPLAVEQVPRNDHEVDRPIDRQANEILEGQSCGAPQLFQRCTVIRLESAQRTVDVQICSVDELHERPPHFLREQLGREQLGQDYGAILVSLPAASIWKTALARGSVTISLSPQRVIPTGPTSGSPSTSFSGAWPATTFQIAFE